MRRDGGGGVARYSCTVYEMETLAAQLYGCSKDGMKKPRGFERHPFGYSTLPPIPAGSSCLSRAL